MQFFAADSVCDCISLSLSLSSGVCKRVYDLHVHVDVLSSIPGLTH